MSLSNNEWVGLGGTSAEAIAWFAKQNRREDERAEPLGGASVSA